MTKNEAVHTVMDAITYGNCKAERFFEAFKSLSKDEQEKVYLAIKERDEFESLKGGI